MRSIQKPINGSFPQSYYWQFITFQPQTRVMHQQKIVHPCKVEGKIWTNTYILDIMQALCVQKTIRCASITSRYNRIKLSGMVAVQQQAWGFDVMHSCFWMACSGKQSNESSAELISWGLPFPQKESSSRHRCINAALTTEAIGNMFCLFVF